MTEIDFLERNELDKSLLEKEGIDINTLINIENDFLSNTQHLSDAAEFLAKMLQKSKYVHSVRWRVKDSSHLIRKIVRKKIDKVEKYQDINENNYNSIITDLVGVRVLHLFKYEWLEIDKYIQSLWTPTEQVVAYIREGDEENILETYKENNCEIKKHPAGYRSIHYIISTQPTLRKIFSEIQVRTIFEEGWSEIDHKVRYPDFSDNELISYFLTIFNRMAGNADEMGSFVRDLTNEISLSSFLIKEHNNKQEEYLARIEELAHQLSEEKEKNQSTQEAVLKLKDEVSNLRKNLSVNRNENDYAIVKDTSSTLVKTSNIINSAKSILQTYDSEHRSLQHAAMLANLFSDVNKNSLAQAASISEAIIKNNKKYLADQLVVTNQISMADVVKSAQPIEQKAIIDPIKTKNQKK